MYNAANFAIEACEKMHGCHVAQHSACLQKRLSDYFSEDDICEVPNKMSQSRLVHFFIASNTELKT